MGCINSSTINVKRSQIQLFQNDKDNHQEQSDMKDNKDYIEYNQKQHQIINNHEMQKNMMNSNLSQQKQKSQHIKTMTFNIANQDTHAGFSEYRARNIAKHILQEQPQIIGFQELRENSCIKNNQLEIILKEMKKLQPKNFNWYSVWMPSMIYKKMGVTSCVEGLGLISQFKIKSFKQEMIPLDPKGQDKNQRAILIVDLEDFDLQICVTHLSYIDGMQLEQTQSLRRIIDNEYIKSEVNINQIILGDFNYHDDQKSKYLLEDSDLRGFKDTAIELNNIQKTWRFYRYDRIFYRGRSLIPASINYQESCKCNLTTKNTDCTQHYCSDHLSLCSSFIYEF